MIVKHFRALIVSVDYGDLLEVTLPWNRHHFSEVMIVTTERDTLTQTVAKRNDTRLHITNAFYHNNTPFSKFRAMEEALDIFGRNEWMAFVDADTLWPSVVPDVNFYPYRLYSFRRRRMLVDVVQSMPPESDWNSLPIDPQSVDPLAAECMGFTQIFHATDYHLGRPPWHDITLPTAALGDSYFQQKWCLTRKTWIDADCLHLGEVATNWTGRVTRYRDGTIPKEAESRRQNTNDFIQSIWGNKEQP